ncbi:MAG: hypothetical protein D0528_10420, partial [Methylococcales bacterium]
ELVSNIPIKQNASHILWSWVNFALGFSFASAASRSVTNVLIKIAGSYINVVLKYVEVYTNYLTRFSAIFQFLKT